MFSYVDYLKSSLEKGKVEINNIVHVQHMLKSMLT